MSPTQNSTRTSTRTSTRSSLLGFGRTATSTASTSTFTSDQGDDLADAIRELPERGGIARGLGRAYGDSAQNGGGAVLRLCPGAGDISVDEEAATATVFAGVSIDMLLRAIVPLGYFVPVTAGTKFVTVGGAIASDIHGKNHHLEGSFGNHVRRLRLRLADGSAVEIGPDERPDLFWATVGGMGLTGVIESAVISLLPIESSMCVVDIDRVANLDQLLTLMEQGDRYHRYSVAWLDPLASGRHLGRSVLTRGDHARTDQLEPRRAVDALVYKPRQLGAVPGVVPRSGVFNQLTVRAFNELWYRKAPKRKIGDIQTIPTYFYPLDAVDRWNRLYGARGFVQYQFVVPFGQEDALAHVIERFAAFGAPSFLSVLKRFGAGNPAPLSFPMPGWTLALDLPASVALRELFAGIDDLVLTAGGRHYLSKDAHISPHAITKGYPRLAEWQRIRDAVDPDRVWTSDQARRLKLHG